MNTLRRCLLGAAVGALVSTSAAAEDQNKNTDRQQDKQTQNQDQKQNQKQAQGQKKQQAKQLSTNEVMKITQEAMTHVASAERALERKDQAAARTALQRSEQLLERLYDTPASTMILNEIDEAIAQVKTGQPQLKALDLEPLAASLRMQQVFGDPEVAAGIEKANKSAKQGDAKATEEALRLVRERVVVDLALLPVEEAYVRVIAAQQAIGNGDLKQASKFLRNLPIIVSEVRISAPMVPIRFKLNAAAVAAEEGNWKQSQTLLQDANKDIQELEKLSDKSERSEVSALSNQVQQLSRRMQGDDRPRPEQIRELANRTRSLGG